ncbi:MAG: hypothetical protein R2710_24910 [Acidimicrobiales bacterium]
MDGAYLHRSWVTGDELRRAGLITFELANEPAAWGATTRPPSVSTRGARAPAPPLDLMPRPPAARHRKEIP